jgi:hypothetical protein
MKKDKIILMITITAVAITIILSVPHCAMAQNHNKNPIAESAHERGYLVKIASF